MTKLWSLRPRSIRVGLELRHSFPGEPINADCVGALTQSRGWRFALKPVKKHLTRTQRVWTSSVSAIFRSKEAWCRGGAITASTTPRSSASRQKSAHQSVAVPYFKALANKAGSRPVEKSEPGGTVLSQGGRIFCSVSM